MHLRAACIAALVAACYRPNAEVGAPCSADGLCPSGQTCDRSMSPPTCLASSGSDDARSLDDSNSGPSDAQNTALLVQQTAKSKSSGTPLDATLAQMPTSGNTLVMIGANIGGPLESVSGGGVGTWTRGPSSNINCNEEIWYGQTDGTSAQVAISFMPNGNTDPMWMNVSEWSGLHTPTVDTQSAASGSNEDIDAGEILTTNASDLVLLGASAYPPGSFATPAPGTWTALDPVTTSSCAQGEWYAVVSTATTYDPSITSATSVWDAAIIAFKIP